MHDRTVTLSTIDHGDVTLPEPSWCVGHADHRPGARRADILHRGPDVAFAFRGEPVMVAALAHSPFITAEAPELDSATPGISMTPVGRLLDARAVYELAAALDGYADLLRALADELSSVVAGGDAR